MEMKHPEHGSPEQRTESNTDLPPDLAALEASLASARPQSDAALRERTKAHAMLEVCRQVAPESPDLIETILNAGEQRVTLSLRQYVRMERFRAGAIGVVLGLILGAILNVFGMVFLFMLLKIL